MAIHLLFMASELISSDNKMTGEKISNRRQKYNPIAEKPIKTNSLVALGVGYNNSSSLQGNINQNILDAYQTKYEKDQQRKNNRLTPLIVQSNTNLLQEETICQEVINAYATQHKAFWDQRGKRLTTSSNTRPASSKTKNDAKLLRSSSSNILLPTLTTAEKALLATKNDNKIPTTQNPNKKKEKFINRLNTQIENARQQNNKGAINKSSFKGVGKSLEFYNLYT